MLPDYPRIKKFIVKKFQKLIRVETRKGPVLSRIGTQEVHEGDCFSVTSVEGYEQADFYKKIQAEFGIKTDEIMKGGPEIYYSKAKPVAQQMIDQITKQLFDMMTEVTQKTGNIVDGKSQPLSPDMLFQAMEKVEIDFDELGFPIYPSLFLSPELYDKIKSEIPKWESDPKIMTRQKEIIEKKRKEWLDRESNRKLVD